MNDAAPEQVFPQARPPNPGETLPGAAGNSLPVPSPLTGSKLPLPPAGSVGSSPGAARTGCTVRTPERPQRLQTWRCAVHIHTASSDGELEIAAVIAEAEAAGVDLLLTTDHMLDSLAEKKWEGQHGRVFVLTGAETGSRDQDHFLVFGLHDRVGTRKLSTPEAVRLLGKLGAVFFVAHPQGRPRYYMFKRFAAWNNWELPDYHGIEIWSYMHDWIEGLGPLRLPEMCRNPQGYITGPDQTVLKRWDEAVIRRRLAGIGGLDTHAQRLPFGLSRRFAWAAEGILPYRQNFTAFSHYLLAPPLTGNKREDTRHLLTGFKLGRGWICHDALHSGREFRFFAAGKEQDLPLGSETVFTAGTTLVVQLPVKAEIRLLCRGKCLVEKAGTALEYPVAEPGEYRVEVYLGGHIWIISNHIYLRATLPEEMKWRK